MTPNAPHTRCKVPRTSICRRIGRPGPRGISLYLARAQRHHQLTTFIVAEAFEIERGITLVAQQLDQRRPASSMGG